MSYQTLLVDKKDQITTITLNRPESRNAMSPRLHFEMCDALAEVEKDDDCRVLIVTGAGPAFCAGMDLKEYFFDTEGKPAERLKARKAAYEWMFKRLMLLPKPTIAKVNGWCFGGGFEIVGACDFVIASNTATFGLSEVNWGIFPGGGVTWLMAHMLSPRDAKYLVMTGKTITAQEAADMRLINSAVAPETLNDAVLELAEEFKKKHPAVLAACKEVFRVDQDLTLEHALLWETAKFEELSLTAQNTWHKGVKQFKVDKTFRPGLETYDWKK
jgi:trans-feruloyl-CoA hydratase/vanillin synthase